MKKKILGIIGVMVLLFSLTGCMKFNATMEIKEDKSMDYSIIYAMNKKILEMNEEQQDLLDEKEKQDIINKGFNIEDYEDNDNKGFKLTKKIANLDEYSSESDVEYNLSGIFEENANDKIFKVIKGTDKNKYIANFKFDSNDNNLNEENDEIDTDISLDDSTTELETEGDISDLSEFEDAMTSQLDLKFVVKLPYKPISDNATEKSEDGRELTWKLDMNQVDNIKFEFELNNSVNNQNNINNKTNIFSNIDTSMLIAIVSLVIGFSSLIIVIIFVSKKNKSNG